MSLVRAALLGGVDGVITSFAIVAAARAFDADDARDVVVVVGTSSLLADGISMGVSEYISSTSERALGQGSGEPHVLGAACFVAFVACGAVPIVAIVGTENLLAVAGLSVVELVLLGMARARATGEPVLRGLVQTAGLGAVAGGVAMVSAFVAARFA